MLRRFMLAGALLAPLTACTQHNDYTWASCEQPVMRSADAIGWINSALGKPGGPPARVMAIADVQPTHVSDNTASTRNRNGAVQCHETLLMEGGVRQSGTLTMTDPNGYAPLHVQWDPEASTGR